MLKWLKYNAFPSYNTPEAGGGVPPASPSLEPAPASPPAPTTAPSGEPALSAQSDPSIDETTSFALEAFDAMQQDEIELPEPEAAPVEPPPITPVPQSGEPPATLPTPSAAAPASPGTTPPEPGAAAPTVTSSAVAPAPSGQAPAAPAQSTQAPQQLSFEQIAEELSKQQAALVTQLAESQYKLTEKDLEEFATEPAKVLQRIAAATQVNTTASVMKVFAQQLPVVVQGLVEANRRHREAEELFWSSNPHLDRKKHREVVGTTMQTIRQLNPNMDAQTFIKQVGIYAGMQAGVAPQVVSSAPGGQPQAVRTPGPVVRNTNGAGAFAPVGANAAPPSAHPAPQKGIWEQMAELIDADERGAFDS